MRIAMLTNNYLPFVSGVAVSVDRLARGLHDLGHEIYVFAPEYQNAEEQKGVIRYKTLFQHKKTGFMIPNPYDPSIERHFKELKIDIIHVHHPMLIGWTALYLSKKYDVPLVYTYHTRYEEYLHYIRPADKKEGLVRRALRPVEEWIMKNGREAFVPAYMQRFTEKCDQVIAPSRLIDNDLKERECTTPVTILPTGIENRFFQTTEKDAAIIRQMYGNGKKKVFCTVSRLAKEKNIAFIIDALKTYRQKYGGEFQMLIIGDGPERKTLEECVERAGLAAHVYFLGKIPNRELPVYYKACDVLLFASKSETQGIVILEGMAAGLPVVAIKAGGIEDVIMNGYNGYMTAECTEQYAEKMNRIFISKEVYTSFSESALETAQKFSEQDIAERALNIYQQMDPLPHSSGIKFKIN